MKKFVTVILISLLMVTLAVPAAFASNLPSWYPDDIHAERFHGKNLPAVVDYADIFTDSEEAALTKKIKQWYGYKQTSKHSTHRDTRQAFEFRQSLKHGILAISQRHEQYRHSESGKMPHVAIVAK